MSKKNPPTRPSLHERLREEARALTPDFSPALHEQTLRRIRQATTRRALAMPHRTIAWHWPIAAAAALLLAFSAWSLRQPQSPPPTQPVALALRTPPAIALPNPAEMLSQSTLTVHDAMIRMNTPGIDEIERQAAGFAHFVSQQFPSSESRPASRPSQTL